MIDRKNETMADMWKGFEASVIPADAPPIQRSEMKMAFYGGAHALFTWFMWQLDEDREPTENDMNRITALNAEMEAYVAGIANKIS